MTFEKAITNTNDTNNNPSSTYGKQFSHELKKRLGFYIKRKDGYSISNPSKSNDKLSEFYISHKGSYFAFGAFEDAKEYTILKNAERALLHLEIGHVNCHVTPYDKVKKRFITLEEAEHIIEEVALSIPKD